MTEWFRSWHGAPTDPKWLVISKRAGVAPGVVSAVAWALLDHASQADERGCVADFDFETYSAFSGFDEEQVRAVYAAMEAKGMIFSGRIARWEKRQPRREDSGSGERVREMRRRRAETEPSLPLQDAPAQASTAPAAEAREPPPVLEAPPEADPEPEPVSSQQLVRPQAIRLADEIAVICGHDLNFVPPSWPGAAARVEAWLARGWREPLILEVVRAQVARKRDGPPNAIQYFEGAIARAHERAERPLPTVVPFPESARHGKTQSPITRAIDGLIADLEGGGGSMGEGPIRRLPDG